MTNQVKDPIKQLRLDILNCLFNVLKEGEPLKIKSKLYTGQQTFGRINLPNGCSKLGFEDKTKVDWILELRSDTLYELYDKFKFLKKIETNDAILKNFVFIYKNKGTALDGVINFYKSSKIKEKGFFIFSIKEFKEKCRIEDNHLDDKPSSYDKTENELSKKVLTKETALIEQANIDFNIGKNTLFFGAGLSLNADLPNWDELLKRLLEKANSFLPMERYDDLLESCNHSSLITARYIEKLYQYPRYKKRFKTAFHDALYEWSREPDNEIFTKIAAMVETKKVSQAITFNYDDLVERALEKEGIPTYSISDAKCFNSPNFPIYHVHGFIPKEDYFGEGKPVLGEYEYHDLYKEAFHWSNVVQLQALRSTNCFFIGLSMTDPNLRRLLDIARMYNLKDKDTQCHHYAILERKPLIQDTSSPFDRWHLMKQEQLLHELGINVIWYENKQYGDIPRILEKIMAPL